MGHKVKSVKIKLIPVAPHDARMFYEPVKCFMNAGVEKSASKNGALSASFHFALRLMWIFNTGLINRELSIKTNKSAAIKHENASAQPALREKKLLAAVGLRFFSRYVVEIGLNSSLVSARWRIKMIFMAQSGSSFQFFDCTPAPSLVAICSLGTITSAIILNLAAYAAPESHVCKRCESERAPLYSTFIYILWCLQGVENFDFMRYATSLFACMWRS